MLFSFNHLHPFIFHQALSLLIGLVIWSDVGTHATKELIDQWRIGILRKYFGQLNKNVYENRTALVHVIANRITSARDQLTDEYLLNTFKNNYLSWPFGVAVTAEVFLFMATVLYLTRKDFKVVEPRQFPV
ncbi:unnamed protein product [Hymenolepis diminuta]|uniref:ABC transmembrane type-1 domain-containing protein n=1 Tax=Hymenolepis diminuta TaxID=6216 RepID=A0A0R3SFK7_HYMDI|nr:unnamed protein product [Hymenolepis diminuta]